MINSVDKNSKRVVRHKRVRKNLSGTASRPRLCVYRSLNEIYAQVIDDTTGNTIVSASTREAALQAQLEGKTKTEQAKVVGTEVAKRALAKKINEVVFDRGGYLYIGRVQALADSARDAGLKF